jgi:hypothetical protein
MKRLAAMTAVVAMLGGACVTASAAPIFADDFNRAVSASVGNGWSETESDDVDVSIVARSSSDRQMQVRDDDPRGMAWQHTGISTFGYASVSLAYDWAPSNNTEAGDFLWVEWRDGAASGGPWTVIASHALVGPAAHASALHEVLGASDIADFEFRFRVVVDSNNEGALIDNVALSGVTLERGSVQSVPEPGTLALAGLSLVLLSTTAPRSRRLGRSNWGGR